jgi:hypothetical protein
VETLNLEQLKKEKMKSLDSIDFGDIEEVAAAARTHFRAIAELAISKPIDEDSIAVHQEAIDYLTTPETKEIIDLVRLQVAIESMQQIKEKFGGNPDDLLCLADRSQYGGKP